MKKYSFTHSSAQEGYILILTLLLLSLMGILVSLMVWQGTAITVFDKTTIAREKARTLAFSALQIGYSQLALMSTATTKKDEAPKEKQEDATIAWMKKVLPVLNRTQQFTLQESVDGINAEVGICIACEQGKLDINQIFDFKEKKFITTSTGNDMREICQEFFELLKPLVKNQNLFPALEKYFKSRSTQLDDVTELLNIPEFSESFGTHIFYAPPQVNEKNQKRTIFLTDLFTCFNPNSVINPLFLSDSMSAVFQLTRAKDGDVAERIKHFTAFFEEKDVQNKLNTLEQIWDSLLKKPYGKEFKQLNPLAKKLFMPSSATHFSVLAYAVIEGITQKIFAIIERRVVSETEEGEEFVINRLYWL